MIFSPGVRVGAWSTATVRELNRLVSSTGAKRLAERGQHRKSVPFANALDFVQGDFVSPADEKDLACKLEVHQVTHHVDGVRFAERQVQYDDLGDDQLELLKHGCRFRELNGLIAAVGQNADDGGTHAGIVIKNVNRARASLPVGGRGCNLAHTPNSSIAKRTSETSRALNCLTMCYPSPQYVDTNCN